MHTDEVVAFVNAIHDGTPSPVPSEHGMALNSIFDALYKSAETGKEEPVEG
jgi:predicted dehydrogenase